MHIDTDSLDNSSIRPSDFKEKARKVLRVSRHRDYYGDVIFGEFDYFCSVELTIHLTRLDYRFRMCEYQLSNFARKDKKEEI